MEKETYLVILLLMILITSCKPSYDIESKQKSLSGQVGEKVIFQVSYNVNKGNVTDPIVTSSCKNVNMVNQSVKGSLTSGIVTAEAMITSYDNDTLCLKFESDQYSEWLNITITPAQNLNTTISLS